MVSTPELSAETRARIAEQLSPALEALTALAPLEGQLSLGESLPIVMLTEQAILEREVGGLAERVTDIRRWHHQIYDGDSVPLYARSEAPADGGEPTELAEVAHSSLPHAIRAAMAWIDEMIPDEGEAHLVLVPSHQVTALWLKGPDLDHVLVLSAPRRIEEFAPRRPLEQRAFLNALARTPAIPGVGLTDDEGEDG